ncbi:MAG: type II secretion system protein GspG [Thermoguttaceae bacterium]|jgi:hypothetical protein
MVDNAIVGCKNTAKSCHTTAVEYLFGMEDSMSTELSSPPPPVKRTAGCLAYAIGGASFIPLIGVVFGIIAIVWGILRRVPSLMILGIGGILFTIAVYGALFYFGFCQRGGVYDKLRAQMAVTMLNGAVKEVEYYKLQHGHYPSSLRDLDTKDPNKLPTVFDPTFIERKGTNDPYFYYELDPSGTSYFLRSVGRDGIPFTADDILPSISEEERKHTGLKLER